MVSKVFQNTIIGIPMGAVKNELKSNGEDPNLMVLHCQKKMKNVALVNRKRSMNRGIVLTRLEKSY